VIFPPQASVLSAFGALVTPVRFDLVRSALAPLDRLDWVAVDRILGDLTGEGVAALAAAGSQRDSVRLRYGADLRYSGQQNEVSVTLDADPRAARDTGGIRAAFERAYHAQYGVNPSHVPIEVVSWRVTAEGAAPDGSAMTRPPERAGAAKGKRAIGLWPDAGAVPVYDRAALAAGQAIAGPGIVEERETTAVLPPGWTARVDAIGCLIATEGARS
jgi:N-methylhydantoinase A